MDLVDRISAWAGRSGAPTEADAIEAVGLLAEAHAEILRLREVAEDVYGPWSCGEPLDREMRELGRAIGMTLDPA